MSFHPTDHRLVIDAEKARGLAVDHHRYGNGFRWFQSVTSLSVFNKITRLYEQPSKLGGVIDKPKGRSIASSSLSVRCMVEPISICCGCTSFIALLHKGGTTPIRGKLRSVTRVVWRISEADDGRGTHAQPRLDPSTSARLQRRFPASVRARSRSFTISGSYFSS